MRTARFGGGAPTPRHSLRLRLPALITLLVAALLGTFLWSAYFEVRSSLLRAGNERAQAAADQLASVFERSFLEGEAQLRELAADADVRRYLLEPTPPMLEVVQKRLGRLTTDGARRVELWNEAGIRVLEMSMHGTGGNPSLEELPPGTLPTTAGVSEFQPFGLDSAYSDAVVEVVDGEPAAERAGAGRVGFLTSRSAVAITLPTTINELVGSDAFISFGSKAGGVWTDLSRVVTRPPVDVSKRGIYEYQLPSGETRLAAVAGVRGTPWAVSVAFRRDTIVAPARQFLARMLLLAVAFMVVAAGLVTAVTVRMTTPLHELSVVATQIAAGDYSRRVGVTRRDEIGRLGHAFNAMAGDIQSMYGALKENHDRTVFALGVADMGIWEIDRVTDRVTWSDTLVPVFGLTPDRVPRTTEGFFGLVHPADRPSVLEAMRAAIDHRHADYSVDFRVRWPDDSVHWLHTRVRVIYAEDGNPTRLLGVATDVTIRRNLEAQLRQAHKLEAIGHLAGGVAHDFNNLLTAVLGYTSLIKDGLDAGDPLQAPMSEIRKAGERGARLTRQLLAFSRQQVLDPTVVNLNALVSNTGEMLRRLIGEHIELSLKLSPDLVTVLADRSQLEQIVINLAVNARDAMPDGGMLVIETANVELDESYAMEHVVVRPGAYVMLAVSDTGMGMDEDTRRRVFEPFFTTKERGKGTGLGLATVYGIVQQSGGYVWVYSEEGKGASFKIYLPRAGEINVPDRPAAVRDVRPAGSEMLLLVEDDDAVRYLVRGMLERAGYRVVEAANAEEAELAWTNEIALIVSDVIMPGRSGPELFRKLAVDRPGLKVLYISGYTDDMIAHRGRLDHGAAFLQKPFTSAALLDKVRDTLDS